MDVELQRLANFVGSRLCLYYTTNQVKSGPVPSLPCGVDVRLSCMLLANSVDEGDTSVCCRARSPCERESEWETGVTDNVLEMWDKLDG
jgi:hypothetical protein